ncbi:MAG: Uma2 family endonuclease [Trueperaceae bacterium]
MAATPQTLTSPQEYLELERKAAFKSEYRHGLIVPMPGASPEHIYIKSDLHTELGICLKSTPCELYDSDLKVRSKSTYSYPDLTIVCDEPFYEYDADKNGILLNPTLIVEVLSPSTEAYDRGNKFAAYRELTSFKEYLLISQTQPLVEQYVKQVNKSWTFSTHQGLDASVKLESVNCTFALKDIYRRVKFEENQL